MKPWRVFLAYPETAQPVTVLTFRSDIRADLRVLAEDLNTTTDHLLAGTIAEVLRGHLDGLDPDSGVCVGYTSAGDPLVFIDLGPGDQTLLDAWTTSRAQTLGGILHEALGVLLFGRVPTMRLHETSASC
jgi:hypothetical protein